MHTEAITMGCRVCQKYAEMPMSVSMHGQTHVQVRHKINHQQWHNQTPANIIYVGQFTRRAKQLNT